MWEAREELSVTSRAVSLVKRWWQGLSQGHVKRSRQPSASGTVAVTDLVLCRNEQLKLASWNAFLGFIPRFYCLYEGRSLLGRTKLTESSVNLLTDSKW